MKKLILTLLTLLCIYLYGCIPSPTMSNSLPTDWKDEQVKAYFNSINSITELSKDLINKGYHWDSDGLNIILFTDTFATPNRVLGQGFGNCNDFAALFLNYCVIEKKADEVTQYLAMNTKILENQWHYYSTIRVNDKWYHQSNLSIMEIQKTEEATLYWVNKGYGAILKWKEIKIK